MSYFGSVYERRDISGSVKAVYIYLLDRANSKGECWPAVSTIGKELSLSRRTVQRAISELESKGLLAREDRWRENGGRSSNLYYVSAPEQEKADPSRPGRSPPIP